VLADVLYLADVALVCHAIGRPVLRLHATLRPLSPVVGLAIVGAGTTMLYTHGLSIDACAWLWHGVAAAALVFSWIVDRDLRVRRPEPATFVALGTLLLLLLPKWIGGRQFTVFQGNQWDYFGYFQAAVGYTTRSFAFLTGAGRREFLDNPVWLIARDNLRARPAIHLTFAVTAGNAAFRSHMASLAYTFLAFLTWLAALAVRTLAVVIARARPQVLTPSRLNVLGWIVGSTFAVGFWGQYVFDINAWSQSAGMPIVIALVACVIATLTDTAWRDDRARVIVATAILTCGGLYLYPEILLFHLGPILAGAAFAALMGLVPRTTVYGIVAAMLLGISAGAICPDSTIGFGLRQSVVALRTPNNYWTYFQRFLFGRGSVMEDLHSSADAYLSARALRGRAERIDWLAFLKNQWLPSHGWLGGFAAVIEVGVSLLAGVCGLYFYTPAAGLSAAMSAAWSILLGGYVWLLCRSAVSVSRTEIARAADGTRHNPALAALIIIVAGLVAEMIVLIARRQFWPAGKALSMTSPYLTLLLLWPLLASRWSSGRRLASSGLCAAAFVALQLGSGVARVACATAADGIHYSAASYPSVQPDAVTARTAYDWASIDRSLDTIARGDWRLVEIATSDVWVRNYVMARLTLAGRAFLIREELHSYFSTGYSLGVQPWNGRTPDGSVREHWVYQPAVSRYRYELVAQ
jgi:hypothetical protein